MKPIFVDTSGWMACADVSDAAHLQVRTARDAALRDGRLLLTTDFVADETLTLIRLRLGLDAARAWLRQVEDSPRLRWERIDEKRFERSRELFFRFHDKEYSFTDCTSFALMRELKLTDALATDRHFRQAGFQSLPAPRKRTGSLKTRAKG
jgi:predicted nucleic acid-binding protein